MPFKSKDQMRAFFAMEGRGDLPKGTAKRWAHETKNLKKLPEKKSSFDMAFERGFWSYFNGNKCK